MVEEQTRFIVTIVLSMSVEMLHFFIFGFFAFCKTNIQSLLQEKRNSRKLPHDSSSGMAICWTLNAICIANMHFNNLL